MGRDGSSGAFGAKLHSVWASLDWFSAPLELAGVWVSHSDCLRHFALSGSSGQAIKRPSISVTAFDRVDPNTAVNPLKLQLATLFPLDLLSSSHVATRGCLARLCFSVLWN
jgi:hypothetical protein